MGQDWGTRRGRPKRPGPITNGEAHPIKLVFTKVGAANVVVTILLPGEVLHLIEYNQTMTCAPATPDEVAAEMARRR